MLISAAPRRRGYDVRIEESFGSSCFSICGRVAQPCSRPGTFTVKITDIGNAVLWRARRAFLRLQLFFQLRLNWARIYEPDPWSSRKGDDRRESAARAAAILDKLPSRPLSGIDVGCHIGYFTFALARRGGFCVGLDYGRNEIMIAQALATVHNIPNVAFAQVRVDAAAAASLPHADAVICLSVYHHWVRKLGRAEADKIMEILASRAGRFLIFDTGQPDETGASWASDLNFMLPDIDGFLRRYLASLGFATVSHIGTFQTTVSPVPRHLYIAERETTSP
jgi:SAM-dependent methyltransferase